MQSNYEPIPRNKSLTVLPPPPAIKPTIKAPKAILASWLTALRSGIFKQGKGRLLASDGGLCCLGVLQAVTDGDVERYSKEESPSAAGLAKFLPERNWLKSKGITFNGRDGNDRECAPFLPTLGVRASEANDGLNGNGGEAPPKTFAEIADAIEACSEGY